LGTQSINYSAGSIRDEPKLSFRERLFVLCCWQLCGCQFLEFAPEIIRPRPHSEVPGGPSRVSHPNLLGRTHDRAHFVQTCNVSNHLHRHDHTLMLSAGFAPSTWGAEMSSAQFAKLPPQASRRNTPYLLTAHVFLATRRVCASSGVV
jgi:hypothetical protein